MRFLSLLLLFSDWPQFLGPNRDGRYTDKDIPWPPTAIAWQRDIGEGFAGPVIANGKVILFHRRKKQEIVEAFETATGKTVWTFEYHTDYRDDYSSDEGPRSAPTVQDGRVYVYGPEGILHALDLETGRKIWRTDVAETFHVKKGFFGAGCSPLLDGGQLFLNVGGKDVGVAAFDAANGKIKWAATKQAASYSSPVKTDFGIAFFTKKGLVVTSPSGKTLFEYELHSRSELSVNAASPVVSGKLLFVTSAYGAGAAAFDFSETPPRKLWYSDDVLSSHYATPVVKDGYLYGLHGAAQTGQELRAVEMSTGTVAWKMPVGGSGSVTMVNSELLLLRDDGQMFMVHPDPKKLDVRGNFKVMDGKVRAYPAVGNGMICFRNTKVLACLR